MHRDRIVKHACGEGQEDGAGRATTVPDRGLLRLAVTLIARDAAHCIRLRVLPDGGVVFGQVRMCRLPEPCR